MLGFKRFRVKRKVTDFVTVETGIKLKHAEKDLKNLIGPSHVVIKSKRSFIYLQFMTPFKAVDSKGRNIPNGFNFKVMKPPAGFTRGFLVKKILELLHHLKHQPSYLPLSMAEVMGIERIGSGHYRVIMDHESAMKPLFPDLPALADIPDETIIDFDFTK